MMSPTIRTWLWIVLLSLCSNYCAAVRSCETDAYCQTVYNTTETHCSAETGTCTNPFQKGCLRTRLGEQANQRVCNSDDRTRLNCRVPSLFDYPELRIHNGNWETSVLGAWIYQILLMELVEVPATVGLTTQDTAKASFYSSDNTWEYSVEAYPYNAMGTANAVTDCTLTDAPCVHVLPEVWTGSGNDHLPFLQNDTVETPSANGMLGRSGFQVPDYTAKKFPNLGIYHGLAGEENRGFLAETFKRPLTWMEYCTEVSTRLCFSPDGTATRPPIDGTGEASLYFAEGLYAGYFQATEKNDCQNTTNCTGHVAIPPCSWSSPSEAQLYWNDIVGLEPGGSQTPNGGYTQEEMIQLWYAANATKSDLIMYWYLPEPLFIEFMGTESEMQLITFPLATAECLANRPNAEERCSDDVWVRRGDPRGACGNPIEALQRFLASSVGDNTYSTDEVNQSPAYEMIKNTQLSNNDLGRIIQQWDPQDTDPDGNDARQAVCDWVVDNLDSLVGSIPQGYPRVTRFRSDYSTWYHYAVQGFGGFIAVLALVGFSLVARYSETKTMVFAQPAFMHLILTGFCLIGIGAVLYAMEPTTKTCTSSSWLILLGYTIELVPVLVKTAAINKLIRSSKKMKRVNISRRIMLLKVAGIVVLVLAFLISWTLVDQSTARETRTLETRKSGTFVESEFKCGSESDVWRLTAYAWQAVLLLLAAFLAFQSRDIMQQLNDSKSLAVMVYSHFLFVCLRGVCSVFYVYDTLPASSTAALLSFSYSMDALFAMSIYVLPKLVTAKNAPEPYKPGLSSGKLSSVLSRRSAEFDNEEEDLQVLLCTANIGNAEPTVESMESWIPPGGNCDRVNCLEGESLPPNTFDVIVIGMQEATWTEKIPKEQSIRGTEITEEEILNALEEKNTAQLREMIQDILGESYFQLVDERRGQMRLQVWASKRVVGAISDVRVSGANTGIGNMLANKGGIVATLTYQKTRISFVSAHLAAHEGNSYYKNRCDNIETIFREGSTYEPSNTIDVSTCSHHTFFMGDLNFRTKFDSSSPHEVNVKRALDYVTAKDYAGLYSYDELHKGIEAGHLLVEFKTLPCKFPPTFKVQREPYFVYKQQRTPSYTDRILFKSAASLGENLIPRAYEPCMDFITSDHKPIRGAFTIAPNQSMRTHTLDSHVRLEFKNMKCSNLPAADNDGKSDPYLVFMWDGVDLHCDYRSLVDKIRELFSRKVWPKTSYIPKDLNPSWGDETVTIVSRKNTTTVGSDALLFISVFDFDTVSADDFLGALTLNVQELLTFKSRESKKKLRFDRPLIREGKPAGRISFDLVVSRKIPKRH